MIADLLRFNRELRAILEGAEPQLDERSRWPSSCTDGASPTTSSSA